MLHTKAQLTFPAWLVTMFSMRLNEENQKEDCLVLQIQRLTNTVALMWLLGLSESRGMIKIYRFTLAAVEPACWLDLIELTPHVLVQLAILKNTLSYNLPLSMGILTPACSEVFWLQVQHRRRDQLHDGHDKTVDVRPLGKRKELIDFYILSFRRTIQSSDDYGNLFSTLCRKVKCHFSLLHRLPALLSFS